MYYGIAQKAKWDQKVQNAVSWKFVTLSRTTLVDILDDVYEQREIKLERPNTIQNINYKHETKTKEGPMVSKSSCNGRVDGFSNYAETSD